MHFYHLCQKHFNFYAFIEIPLDYIDDKNTREQVMARYPQLWQYECTATYVIDICAKAVLSTTEKLTKGALATHISLEMQVWYSWKLNETNKSNDFRWGSQYIDAIFPV